MTLRTVVSACCGIIVLLASAQARGVECATEAQRKIEIESLNESVDWFLSIVEEVPEGIARQFGAAKADDEKVFRQAIAHPLWYAYKVREAGDNIKRALRPWMYDTSKDHLGAAIIALQHSAAFSVALNDYLDHDRGRIIDAQNWAFRYTVLPADIARYALCLVGDLASSRAGSNPPPPR